MTAAAMGNALSTSAPGGAGVVRGFPPRGVPHGCVSRRRGGGSPRRAARRGFGCPPDAVPRVRLRARALRSRTVERDEAGGRAPRARDAGGRGPDHGCEPGSPGCRGRAPGPDRGDDGGGGAAHPCRHRGHGAPRSGSSLAGAWLQPHRGHRGPPGRHRAGPLRARNGTSVSPHPRRHRLVGRVAALLPAGRPARRPVRRDGDGAARGVPPRRRRGRPCLPAPLRPRRAGPPRARARGRARGGLRGHPLRGENDGRRPRDPFHGWTRQRR